MAKHAGLDIAVIVQEAAKMADKDGLYSLNMATLATQLGVRTPALYHYFAGLAGLRRHLSLLGLQKLEVRVGRALMGKAGDDAVLALAYSLRDFAVEHPGLYEAASHAPDPQDHEWLTRGRGIVEIMIHALSAYNLSGEDARRVIRMIRSIVHGYISLEQMGGFGLPSGDNETFRWLLVALQDYLHNHLIEL